MVSEAYAAQPESGKPLLLGRFRALSTDGTALIVYPPPRLPVNWMCDKPMGAVVVIETKPYGLGTIAEYLGEEWMPGVPMATNRRVVRIELGQEPHHLPGWTAAYYG